MLDVGRGHGLGAIVRFRRSLYGYFGAMAIDWRPKTLLV
jgi:hypothetical protein